MLVFLETNEISAVRNILVDKELKSRRQISNIVYKKISKLLVTHFQMLASMASAGLSVGNKDAQAA